MYMYIFNKIRGRKSQSSSGRGGGISGAGYMVLNIIRVCNIISLLAVVVASWIMLVMTVKTSNFYFFDGVSHFITSSIGLFLIVSELDLFKSYFERCWPLYSPQYGLLALGLSMVAVGFNILGNLNKQATSVSNLGLPLWREVIAAGILCSVFGFFNIVAGYIWADKAHGLTSRQVRSHGAAAHADTMEKLERPVTPTLPSYHPQDDDRRRSKFGMKFPIRISKLQMPVPISNPISNDPEQFAKWENRSSPIAEGIQRPPTALHPAFGSGHRDYSPSRYSAASGRPF